MSFFDVNRSGELVSRLSLDTSIMGKSVSNNLSDGLRSLISTSLGIGAMAFVNLKLTLIMMSIVPPVALAAIWYGRVVRDLSMRTQDAYGEANRVSDEKLGNIRTGLPSFSLIGSQCVHLPRRKLRDISIPKRFKVYTNLPEKRLLQTVSFLEEPVRRTYYLPNLVGV